jgi:hypothetical protein
LSVQRKKTRVDLDRSVLGLMTDMLSIARQEGIVSTKIRASHAAAATSASKEYTRRPYKKVEDKIEELRIT